MKATAENIAILKKLGFSCDMARTGNDADEDWYSLTTGPGAGWGFRLDAIKGFKQLIDTLITTSGEEEE